MEERQRSWCVVQAWTSCRVSMHHLSHWSGQQQHLLQWLQALGAHEMQWVQVLDKGPWLQMYMVPGNCMPLGLQTTKGGLSRTWQAGGGSFLLLSRRHALSSWWLWTFNQNVWKPPGRNSRSCYQFSLPTTSLSRHVAACTALVWSAMLHASEMAIDKAKPPMSAAEWQGNDQTDLQCQAARRCHNQVQWATCAAWQWGSGPHSEGELRWYGHVECSNSAVKTAFDIQVDGKGGPGRPKMIWKQLTERDCREWNSSQLSTLMIDIPGDLMWDLPCEQQASYKMYLEGGPLMWMLPLYLHIN